MGSGSDLGVGTDMHKWCPVGLVARQRCSHVQLVGSKDTVRLCRFVVIRVATRGWAHAGHTTSVRCTRMRWNDPKHAAGISRGRQLRRLAMHAHGWMEAMASFCCFTVYSPRMYCTASMGPG